ncbi:hypothetical protein MAPG_07831 [Magnaporthiopsis poae ATCC 64411]|uniref:Uncharacterized protein n=1 Tax=Magnaporthiopsis poae (strain ATCC 64411 / 73-15) TaxID=644358 RepID=A0A0C4E5Q7_MAGP6|nr:hypothetical protein MAPG_07831 [Magnaporthiopsis poae ATCC 64411]
MAAHVARPAAVSGPPMRGPVKHGGKARLQIEESLVQWLSALTVRDLHAEAPSPREEQKGKMRRVLSSTLRSVPDQKTASSAVLPASSLVAAEVGQVDSRSDVGVTEATEDVVDHGGGAGNPGPKDRSLLSESHHGLACSHDSSASNSSCSSGSDNDRGNGGGAEGPGEPGIASASIARWPGDCGAH